MGFNVSICPVQTFIKAMDVTNALDALNRLVGGKEWSRVTEPTGPEKKYRTFKEAITAWRYSGDWNQDQTEFWIEEFCSDKLGDEEVFWYALAPFLNPEAEVFFSDQEDNYWYYTFTDGKMYVHTGEIVYNESAQIRIGNLGLVNDYVEPTQSDNSFYAVNMNMLKESASQLLSDGTNHEYDRALSELIAEFDTKKGEHLEEASYRVLEELKEMNNA